MRRKRKPLAKVPIQELVASRTWVLADRATQASVAEVITLLGGPAYDGVGGPCYSGVGGPAYDGVGGPAYDGVGGPCYRGVGGPAYDGVGGGPGPFICMCKIINQQSSQ